MNTACELSTSLASTTLCNSSLCVSMLCLETVLACIVALLINYGPFNRRPSTCKVRVDHGGKDFRVSKSSRLTVKLPHLALHTVTPDICSCEDRACVYAFVYSRGKACIGPQFMIF